MANPTDTPTDQLYVSQKEIDFNASINYEVIEKIVGQSIRLWTVDATKTKVHPLYGESIEKVFKAPISIRTLVYYDAPEAKSNSFSTEITYSIKVYFHKRMIKEKIGQTPREGDIVQWGAVFYEITSITEPQLLWGRQQNKVMLEAHCKVARLDEIGLLALDQAEEQY